MAKSPLHKCNKPGCNALTSGAYCDKHKPKAATDTRPSAAARGYDSRWQKARRTYLDNHPFCAMCLERGIHTHADVVDHIVPHRGDRALFWDSNNWQPLCTACHNRKTALHDGGFGRR